MYYHAKSLVIIFLDSKIKVLYILIPAKMLYIACSIWFTELTGAPTPLSNSILLQFYIIRLVRENWRKKKIKWDVHWRRWWWRRWRRTWWRSRRGRCRAGTWARTWRNAWRTWRGSRRGRRGRAAAAWGGWRPWRPPPPTVASRATAWGAQRHAWRASATTSSTPYRAGVPCRSTSS